MVSRSRASLRTGASLRKGDGLEDRGRPPGLRAGLKDWGSFEDGEGGLKDGGWPQGQGVALRMEGASRTGVASRKGGGLEDRGDFVDRGSLKDGVTSRTETASRIGGGLKDGGMTREQGRPQGCIEQVRPPFSLHLQ